LLQEIPGVNGLSIRDCPVPDSRPQDGPFRVIWAFWALSWIVAFPTLLVVLPLVRRIVALVVEPPAPAR
jgi:hypothetical protein